MGILDGTPPAFIILTYIVGLMGISLGLYGALKALHIEMPITARFYRLTLPQLGLYFFLATTMVSLTAAINVWLGADRHIFDSIILTSLPLLHAFPIIAFAWLFSGNR